VYINPKGYQFPKEVEPRAYNSVSERERLREKRGVLNAISDENLIPVCSGQAWVLMFLLS